MPAIALALGLAQSGGAAPDGSADAPQLLALADAGGGLEVSTGDGVLDLTISGTAEFDGTYQIDPAAVSAGPVNLVPPAVTGQAVVGLSVSLRPGLWVYAGDIAPLIEWEWQRDGVAIPGASGQSYTVAETDAGRTLRVRETADGEAAVSAGVVATQPSSFEVSRIGGFAFNGDFTATPGFTLDLSGYRAGDRILLFYGPMQYATAATLDGVAATKISTDTGGSGSNKVAAFEAVLSGPGSASAAVDITIPAARAQHILSAHAVRGGQVTSVGEDSREVVAVQLSSAITLNPIPNAVLACAMTTNLTTGNLTWGGGVTLVESQLDPGLDRSVSLAEGGNLTGGAVSVTLDWDQVDRLGMIAVAIGEI